MPLKLTVNPRFTGKLNYVTVIKSIGQKGLVYPFPNIEKYDLYKYVKFEAIFEKKSDILVNSCSVEILT